MKPTIISKTASNWVDRGESAIPTLSRVLAHFFNRRLDDNRLWLEEHANTVLGMVAADATEVHITGYLNSVARESAPDEHRNARGAAIALWHIGKAALVRDFAERVLQGEVPLNVPTEETLSAWLAQRLLTPAEPEQMSHEETGEDRR
ncbi:MAG TPA: hypothetical protein VGM82_04565 [Gemmatimonadaceae bacterium]|jgi:hypothetical protein